MKNLTKFRSSHNLAALIFSALLLLSMPFPGLAEAQQIPHFDPSELADILRARRGGLQSGSFQPLGPHSFDRREPSLTMPPARPTPSATDPVLAAEHYMIDGFIRTIQINWANAEAFFDLPGVLRAPLSYSALADAADQLDSCASGKAVYQINPCIERGTLIDGVPVSERDPRVIDPTAEQAGEFRVNAAVARLFNSDYRDSFPYPWLSAGAYRLSRPEVRRFIDGRDYIVRTLQITRTLYNDYVGLLNSGNRGFPRMKITEYYPVGTTRFDYSTVSFIEFESFPHQRPFEVITRLEKDTNFSGQWFKVRFTDRLVTDAGVTPWRPWEYATEPSALDCLMLYYTLPVRTEFHPISRHMLDHQGWVPNPERRDNLVVYSDGTGGNIRHYASCPLPWRLDVVGI